MDLIDLHAHTTASDGSLTPGQLVDLAKKIGLKALAVTDHDTLDGLPEAIAHGAEVGLEVVPGVEISAEFRPGTMHILGYFIDPGHPDLSEKLRTLQEARRTRNPRIAAKLRDLGLAVAMEEVEAAAGSGQVGRPHFARVLIEKNYVADIEEAFDRYLGKGAPAYVDKFRLYPKDALTMIRGAGGIAVLAHPFTLDLDPEALESLLLDLAGGGLEGIEVYYSEHTPEMTSLYLALAERLGLLPTGGSDFHGENKQEIALGRGLGDLIVPYDLLAGLKKRKGDRK
jgi:predicted metal-dependent phosphoesterase TrpH